MKPLTTRFRAGRFSRSILNVLYPEAPVCALCHHLLRNLAAQRGRGIQLVKRSQGPSENRSPVDCLTHLVCPLCLEDGYTLAPACHQRNLRVARPVTGLVEGPNPAQILLSDTAAPRVAPSMVVPVYSAFPYEGFVQRLIRPWKYDGVIEATNWFADAVEKILRSQRGTAFDIIVPVPTSVSRLRERGYHHTLLLATELSNRFKKPVVQCLVRNSGADTQTAKSADARRQTLLGVFEVGGVMSLRGAAVLLVDDVVTTGATLQACASKLVQAQVHSVVCSVIAHVV